MKFALVNNQRQEAIPKTKGICPGCNAPVIAKCGTKRVHHWAHETKQDCKNDRWEKEGPWHQNWKSQFPQDWQEQIMIINNEKNIADIKTPQGLVIEFQHSHITPEEQKAREEAYKNMIWVVDGTRLKQDFIRFQERVIKKRYLYFILYKKNWKLFSINSYCEVFPKNWIASSVPVIFDFLGQEKEENSDKFRKYLYCLLPVNKIKRNERTAFLFFMPRKDFIPFIINNEWNNFYDKLQADIWERILEDKKEQERILNNELKEQYKGNKTKYKRFYDKFGFCKIFK